MFAWSISRDREVRVVLRWPASMDEPRPFEIELESRWEGREAPTMAWFARPSATAGWVSAEPAAAAEAPEPANAASSEAAESAPASDAARVEAGSGWEVYEPGVAGEASPESIADADDAADRESIARVFDAAEADASPRAEVRAGQLEPADATGHAEAHASLDPERPSSGIARWLQRNFGWFGRRADAAPPAVTAGEGLAPEPATDEAAVATLAPPDAAEAFGAQPVL